MSDLTAGRFLQNALHCAGIAAHSDGDGGSDYIAVRVGDHGVIRIGGVIDRAKENEIHYHPSEHQGWAAVYNPDTEDDDSSFTEFYQSTNRDLAQDTAHVVKAIQNIIAGR
ncbi:hypothetical protein ACFYNX_26370 [Streptomyces sp. NPDC007872]|uniref:hypothetical protein n=1 Tax=Streptomyces sp. NPDC007872 TaxID=3364782 RepID=UPI00369E329E